MADLRGSTPRPSTTFTLWAWHDRVGRWVPVLTGLRGQAAVEELTSRQDRLRRSGEPCVLRLLPVDQRPHDGLRR